MTFLSKPTQIRGRRGQLASVLGNLLDNAQQFAREGSSIELCVTHLPAGGFRTSVHNDGVAISEANLERIWDRFFTTRADQGGTGLGLPIVATVVQSHGGKVDVTSTEADGTVFAFELPR